MRAYVQAIETKQEMDNDVSHKEYAFDSSIENAYCWPTKASAESELADMDSGIRIKETRRVCSDARVEQRAENGFVISCEVPS